MSQEKGYEGNKGMSKEEAAERLRKFGGPAAFVGSQPLPNSEGHLETNVTEARPVKPEAPAEGRSVAQEDAGETTTLEHLIGAVADVMEKHAYECECDKCCRASRLLQNVSEEQFYTETCPRCFLSFSATRPAPKESAPDGLREALKYVAQKLHYLPIPDFKPLTIHEFHLDLLRIVDRALSAPSALSEGGRDTQRLDWLESVMQPRHGYVEVYFAGLRNGDAEATADQTEFNPAMVDVQHAPTLRESIDSAREHWDKEVTIVDRSPSPPQESEAEK